MNKQFGEIIRFGIVGGVATLLQYGIYLLLIKQMGHNPAMTVGYVLSFIFNYLASTYFTFRVKASAKRGAGFALSHVVNYLLQMATLNFFLWVGIPKTLAPIPMFCVCVPVNFLLVRYFLKRK
uniref:GtrA family protein n=3 Tax=unclassified Prevotella TaxID=2638335 RepID=A0AB33JB31_9BACT